MTAAITADSLSEQPAITLLRMTGGLILHQCLYVAATLGIADLLKDRPATAAELAGTLHVDEEALHRVLRLLSAQGVFEEIGCRTFANSPLSECLRTDMAGSVRSLLILRGGPDTLAALGELLFSVTTGKPSFEKLCGSEMFPHLRRSRGQALMFDDAMTALTALWAPRLAAAYEFAAWGSLMDVGGGNGLLLAEILKVHRGLRGVLAEQPDVLERARQRGFFSGELAGRVQFESCDFFRAIPAGCRAYLLKMVIHDWDDKRASQILINCRRTVPKDGVLLLVEYQLGEQNTPSLGKTVDIFMLAVTGGKERTLEQHRDLLASADFRLRRTIPVSDELMIFEAVPV
jgi:O-methyltransferase domain